MRKLPLFIALVVLVILGVSVARVVAQQHWQWPGNGSNDSSDDDDSANRSNSGGGDDDGGNVPGQFDYYALVLSWSPSYCADRGQDDDEQCNRRDGRRYSFVLHGLWPQYERGYPSACRLPRRPFVSEPLIGQMLDIMPSRGLVIHEYRTHGTCSGLDPVQYFTTAHRLFDGITIPARFRNPFEAQFVSPSDIRNEFLSANPKFNSNMIAIVCGGSGRALREVRFCLAKDGKPRACGGNENQSKLCSTDRVFIPPTRSTARGTLSRDALPSSESTPDSLPGPR